MDISEIKNIKWLEVVNLKKGFLYILILILGVSLVFADAEDFSEAKKIIDDKTSCTELTENQFEILGDYLMEQIHPGQAHEVMDKMMGGEGSESLRLMHIAMAKRLYCNDISDSINYGMMGYGMMGSGLRTGTNYGGMMNMMMGGNMGYGMMGNFGYGLGYGYFINLLSLILVIGLIILVYLWIMKLWKEVFKKTK